MDAYFLFIIIDDFPEQVYYNMPVKTKQRQQENIKVFEKLKKN